jgi:hypothetical protein
VAQRNAPRVLGTTAALNAWRTANERGHTLLLKILGASARRTAR